MEQQTATAQDTATTTDPAHMTDAEFAAWQREIVDGKRCECCGDLFAEADFGQDYKNHRGEVTHDVTVCHRCGAIKATVYRGDVAKIVDPRVMKNHVDTAVYFSLTILGGDLNVSRMHGWFDPADGIITQIG